jgi:hypothetical protein
MMPGFLPRHRPEPPKLTDMALSPPTANKAKAADWEHGWTPAQNLKSWFNLIG